MREMRGTTQTLAYYSKSTIPVAQRVWTAEYTVVIYVCGIKNVGNRASQILLLKCQVSVSIGVNGAVGWHCLDSYIV